MKQNSGSVKNGKRLATVLCLFTVLCCLGSTLAYGVEYRSTELPAPEGWSWGIARTINNNGVVAGGIYDTSSGKPYLFDGQTFTEIPLPEGLSNGGAIAISDTGYVVGHGGVGDGMDIQTRAFRFDGQNSIILPSLNYWSKNTLAAAINNSGVVVGTDCDWRGCKPFLFDGQASTEIPLPPRWDGGQAVAINNKGVVVGTVYDYWHNNKPFLFDGQTFTEIPLPEGWSNGGAADINDAGVVVGHSYDALGVMKPFLFDGQTFTEIPLPEGWSDGHAVAINNKGVVLGEGYDPSSASNPKLFIFDGKTFTELPVPDGWKWGHVRDINDSGVVVGECYDGPAPVKPFIATPLFSPEEAIEAILTYFDRSVAEQSLIGNGKTPTASKGKLNALRNMLLKAEDLIIAGNNTESCIQLLDAYHKTDGQPTPPDFVMGDAASELAAMIEDLRNNFQCQ